jgi:hypothetical protein
VLSVVAAAAVATRAAVHAVRQNDLDLAHRLWARVDGDEMLRLWNAPVSPVVPLVVDSQMAADVGTVRSSPASRRMSEQVFDRDGDRCRYCGIPVVTRWRNGDIPLLVDALPELTPGVHVVSGELVGSGKAGALRNVDEAKWMWQKAVADHVVPRSSFGATDLTNLVTACAGCNYEKMEMTLEQLDVIDPRSSDLGSSPTNRCSRQPNASVTDHDATA